MTTRAFALEPAAAACWQSRLLALSELAGEPDAALEPLKREIKRLRALARAARERQVTKVSGAKTKERVGSTT